MKVDSIGQTVSRRQLQTTFYQLCIVISFPSETLFGLSTCLKICLVSDETDFLRSSLLREFWRQYKVRELKWL